MMNLLVSLAVSMHVSAMDVPPALEQSSHEEWIETVGGVVSPYTGNIFDWYEEQKTAALPAEVGADPDNLFVTVERPLAQTIEAEELGDVEEGVSYGLETYGLIDAPIETVLETILFRWGKPVGQLSGSTFPVDPVFSFREEKLEATYGPGFYRTETVMRGGGVAKDQYDSNALLVRGDAASGYAIIGNFLAPVGKTPTTSAMSIILIKSGEGGKTEYRVSGRYTGQSYKIFGLELGRRNFGFNLARIRQAQKEFFGQVAELKQTGKITERRPK